MLKPGSNIAIKVPLYRWDETVAFYRDRVGLREVKRTEDSVVFEFGEMTLWVDRVARQSQIDVWLELRTDDAASALEQLGSPKARRAGTSRWHEGSLDLRPLRAPSSLSARPAAGLERLWPSERPVDVRHAGVGGVAAMKGSVVVTGGARGIGLGIATHLVAEGFGVVVLDTACAGR